MTYFDEWLSAQARLKAAQLTIEQLGDNCPTQILAQRDMIKFEVEYYEKMMIRIATGAAIVILGIFVYIGIKIAILS